MNTATATEKFLAVAATGAIRVGVAGFSRSTLERLVTAGVAVRVTTAGAGFVTRAGDAVRHRPSCVRYAIAA